MNLIISDKDGVCKRKIIENATNIPKKGEFILWGYEPMPKVIKIVYDFNNDDVYITVN